jgi:hypothetical protein
MADPEPFPKLIEKQLRDPDSIKDADLNPRFVFDGKGRLEFVNTTTGAPANLLDHAAEIALRLVAGDGSARGVQGRALHTAGNDPDRRQNDRNPSGAARVASSLRPTSGALMLGFAFSLGPIVDPPPVVIPPASLADLDGTNGFRLEGFGFQFEDVGFSVAGAGDVNGDGFGDVIVGAPERFGFFYAAGRSYVVFGRASGFDASLDLTTLDGTNGFRLDGVNIDDRAGFSVDSAGDFNGDGFSDLIIGARYAIRDRGLTGESYVVFGSASGFGASVDLASLDGTNGFRLEGINDRDYSGTAVAGAGDVNGDGFSDIIVGAPGDPNPFYPSSAGESYVVFGRASGFGASLDLASLDGANGFRLIGVDEDDSSGRSVSGAGDVNGDGFADLIIGAPMADPGGDVFAGESYVVFGRASGFDASLDLATLDGTNGFRLNGIDQYDASGYSVAGAGDVNGDGFADVIIGAGDASHVVFGRASGFGASLDLAILDGSNGFRLEGTGASVASGGDVNGDGFDDLIIGAPGADGESFVVFGRASGFGASLDLATLDGTNGFRLEPIDAFDYGRTSVAAAGDINGDGFSDVIIGAYGAGYDGPYSYAGGESYVVFGGNFTGALTQLGDRRRNKLAGTPFDDVILGAQADDILLGKGGIDVLNGGESDDRLVVLDPALLEGFDLGGGRILGGTGSNTVCLDGAGVILDLGAIPDTRIQGIEIIDLGGYGNSLALDVLEIRNLDDLSNRLTVLGDKTNAVSGSLPGAVEGKIKIKGVRFVTFTVGSAELLVQAGVDTSGIDTSEVDASWIDTSEIDTGRPDRFRPIAGCPRRA